MQYSDTSGMEGLLQECYFWCGSSNGVAPSDYNATDVKRNIREWYRRSIVWWLGARNTGWQFMDETAATNTVADTKSYQLSAAGGLNISDLINITRVEISYDGTNWYKATPLDPNSVTSTGLTDGQVDSKAGLNNQVQPYYVLRTEADKTGYIDIYPTPSSAVTNGLKIYYTENIGTFGGAVTDVPLIPEYFHRMISLGAAYDFLKRNNDPRSDSIMRDIQMFRQEMSTFDKNEDETFALRPSNLNQYN